MPRPSRRDNGGQRRELQPEFVPKVRADRLNRIEASLADIQNTLDVQFKRIAAIQAQLDHLAAKGH